MSNIKQFLFKNIYSVFTSLIFLICIIFFMLIKIILDNMVIISPNLYSESNKLMILLIFFIILLFLVLISFIYVLRSQILDFSNKMCEVIDKVINKDDYIEFNEIEESILSKMQHKLKRLVEILDNDREVANEEKDNVKALIADISHQIKTPIANISMYNETLIERELNREQQKMCLQNMQFQISKLEWLVNALIKMSRLENNIISLNEKEGYIKDTIANSLSGVYLKAEEKNINISIKCPEDIKLNHDKRWTSEAIFNIIENAVKYTENGGNIDITVEQWELFTRINIKDNGIGIAKEDINNIFKRFYRCSEVADYPGVGIGLYLASEIVNKQGGYIKVESDSNGSIFSVFLHNK